MPNPVHARRDCRASRRALLLPLLLLALPTWIAQAASPDPTFGDNGVAVTMLVGPGASNTLEAAARQSDGRIVVGGSALARFTADGALDPTFGGNGSVDVPYRIRGVAIQDDGKIVVVGETREVVGAANVVLARFLADGSVDATFGAGGDTVVDVSGGRDQMNAIAIAPGGDIVVAGCSTESSDRNTAVLRLNGDGVLDATFGNGGIVELDLASPDFDDCANALLVASDGAVLTAGEAEFNRDDGSCTAQDFLILQLTAAGAPDSTFGNEGVLAVEEPCSQSATALYRYDDGRILVGGQGETQATPGGFPDDFGDPDWFVVRLMPNGSPDPTFGAGTGAIKAELGDDEEIAAIAVQSDGHIVAIGELYSPQGSPDPAAARFTAEGLADATFGSGGLATLPSPDTQERIQDGLLLPDGTLLAVGFRIRPQIGTDAFLTQFLADGTTDLAFGDQGVSEIDIPEVLSATARAVLDLPDGKIVAVGSVSNKVVLVRYAIDGSLDPSFGNDGLVITEVPDRRAEAIAAVLLDDGRIAVAATTSLGNEERMTVLRYNDDGSLDPTLDGDGIAIVPAGVDQEARSLLVEPDGSIIVVGSTRGATLDFLAVRLTASGALDGSFGTGGVTTIDFDEGVDLVNKVLRQDDGRLVLLGPSRIGSNIDFALARLTTTGDLDATFGTDGQTRTDFFSAPNLLNDGLLASDGRIIAAGYAQPGNILTRDFAIAAYDSDGHLLVGPGMRGNGPPPGLIDIDGTDEAFAVAEDSQGRYVLAGDTPLEVGLARVGPDLAPDADFGSGGALAVDVGPEQSEARALAIDNAGRIVVAGSTTLPGETTYASGFFVLRYLPESTPPPPDDLIFRDGFEQIDNG